MPIRNHNTLHLPNLSPRQTCASERMCKTFHFGPKVAGVKDVKCTAGTKIENSKVTMTIPLRAGRHEVPTKNAPAIINVQSDTVMNCEVKVKATQDGRLVLDSGSVDFSNPIEIANPVGAICPDKGVTGVITNPLSDFLISAIVDGVQINSDGSVSPQGSVAALSGSRVLPLQKVIEVASKNKRPKVENDIGRALANRGQQTSGKNDTPPAMNPEMMKAVTKMIGVGGELRFETNCSEADFEVNLGWLGTIKGEGPTRMSSRGMISIQTPEQLSLRINSDEGPCFASQAANGSLWGQIDTGFDWSGKPDGRVKLHFQLATKKLGGTGIVGAVASAASMLGVAFGVAGDVDVSVRGPDIHLHQFRTTKLTVGRDAPTPRRISRRSKKQPRTRLNARAY